MYRVLITGDTHGHIQSVLDLMENVEFDEVIHLGDYVKDAAAIGNIYKEIPVHSSFAETMTFRAKTKRLSLSPEERYSSATATRSA